MPQDGAVGHHNDHQGEGINGGDIEEVVGELVAGRGEEAKGHTLPEPGVYWVPRCVEYHALKHIMPSWVQ